MFKDTPLLFALLKAIAESGAVKVNNCNKVINRGDIAHLVAKKLL